MKLNYKNNFKSEHLISLFISLLRESFELMDESENQLFYRLRCGS